MFVNRQKLQTLTFQEFNPENVSYFSFTTELKHTSHNYSHHTCLQQVHSDDPDYVTYGGSL